MRKTFKIACSSLLCLFLTAGTLSACGKTETSDSGSTSAFTWTGLTNVTVAAGDPYDLMDGITVKNSKGTDITSSVVVLTLDENEKELTDLGVYEDFEDFNYNLTGAYTVYYMATEGDTKEIKNREVTVTQQHNIANGDFSIVNKTGFYNWQLDVPGGGTTLEKVKENGVEKPKFNITGIGNAWYALQYISSCNLKEGETYKITIRAKSSNGKSVAFGFEDVANGYAMMQGLTAYTLTDSYADYVSYYTANKDYTNAKAVLYMGYMLEGDAAASYDVTLDSIRIEKVQKCAEVTFTGVDKVSFDAESKELKDFIADPTKGVKAMQGETDLTDRIKVMGKVSEKVLENTNYTLAYVVENDNGPAAIAYRTVSVRLMREFPYSLVNGKFDQNILYWTQDVNAQNPGKAKFEWAAGDNNEGAAKITIENPSTDGWHIQFRQDVSMDAKTNYIIKIRAKASVNRSINLELNTADGGKPSYTINLGTEYTDQEIYYTAPAKTTGFRFLLGGGGTANKDSVIWLDSVEIVKNPDQTQYEAWQMINPTFAQGMKNWGSEGTTFTAGSDANGTYVSTTFEKDTGAGWNIQLRQDAKQFKAGVKYKLIVKASSSVERDVSFEINPNNGDWSASSKFHLTSQVQEFEYEFTPTIDTKGSRVGLLLGGAGIKDSTFKIYRFEIVEVPAEQA